jgi:VCBS repeat protein
LSEADFNRDGKTDYLLFNASTHQSAIWYLSGGTVIGSAYGPTIASGYQVTGAADFGGDGSLDHVLNNPGSRQTAIWYLNNNIFVGGAYGPTLPAGWSFTAP